MKQLKIKKIKLFGFSYQSETHTDKTDNNKQAAGTVYNNCVFGQPIVASIPTEQQSNRLQKMIDIDKDTVVDYVAVVTGFNHEIIERILDVFTDYIINNRNDNND